MSREPANRRELAERYGVPADETQYGHAGQHHGSGTPECPTELHHHHDDRCEPASAEAADRRQRAREAGLDALADPTKYTMTVARGVDAAIETATRVRITREVAAVACEAVGMGPGNFRRMMPALKAAFEAAGFEVEQ